MNFCTYFDSNYLEKGAVCNFTLHSKIPSATLYILCLDDNVFHIVKNWANVIPIHLIEIEQEYPELYKTKRTRLLKEYYATATPFWPLYIFKKYGINKVYYTDADIAFWGDPAVIDNVFADYSIMATDHGFEPPRAGVRFNVGILGYRNDEYCKEFLYWWGEKCIEWCEWRAMPDGRCADQGYLNILHDEPDRFKNFISCPHPGINMGPWNIEMHSLTGKPGNVLIDGEFELVCYHYHEFQMLKNSYYPTGWKHTSNDRNLVYEPYYNLMLKARSGELK